MKMLLLGVITSLFFVAGAHAGNDAEGACCLENSDGHWFCIQTNSDHCEHEGGAWHGSGSECAGEQCPQDMIGACCMLGGCLPSGQSSCEGFFGVWFGPGSTCDMVSCSDESGACCITTPNGEVICVELGEWECGEEGGEWLGPDTVCDDAACSKPMMGACCINGGCLMLSADDCDMVHGIRHEIPCDQVECPAYCPGDVNGDGVVDVNDILIVLSDWGPCN